MTIVKIESGTINDDFIHNWKTLRVTDDVGDKYYFKLDYSSGDIFSFFYDCDTNETTLVEPVKSVKEKIKEFLKSNEIIEQ